MEHILTVDSAIAGRIAATDKGWLAVALCSPDTDGQFLEELGRVTAKPRQGTTLAAWSEAFCAAQMSLHMVRSEGGQTERVPIREARAIHGPALSGGSAPAVAWVETDRVTWRLCTHEQGVTHVLVDSPHPLRNPTLLRDGSGRLWASYDCQERGRDQIHVLPTDKGDEELVIQGRCPSLACAGDCLWLAGERRGRLDAEIVLVRVAPSGEPRLGIVPSADPWNFLPHLCAQPDAVWLAWESTPGFAPDDRQAFFRQIQIRQVDVRTGRAHMVPGLSGRAAPVEVEAFEDRSIFNNIPVHPRLFGDQSGAWLAYRRFRFRGRYCFGWDLLAIPLQTGRSERPIPQALTTGIGFPDTRYGVCLTDEGQVLVAAHCMTQEPPPPEVAWTSCTATHSARDHGLQIRTCGVGDLSPPAPQGYESLTPLIPPRLTCHCPDPPDPPRHPAGLQLAWGDLHGHTCYSKCMPCNDGTPEDVLRFQRDVLGCQVLTLTDHIEYVSASEFRLLADRVGTEASDETAILYGVEWAKLPAHDTNFFACEREVFDRLRAILLTESHIQEVFARIRAELPTESVVAVRHFHGRRGEPHGIDGEGVVETFDGTLERAMEVVQTRGDMMVRPPPPCPPFPADFLKGGADIGLVGGSDHSRGGPLKFCLTGFWVEEVTSEAVFAALRQRRTIASASGKLALWTELSADTVEVAAASATPLTSISVWCDGEWSEPYELEAMQQVVELGLPLHGDGTAAPTAVVRAEARPVHPGWPPVVGYARPALTGE
ncbi:hypothetical protein ACFL6X_09125 [Candidatus Latescibacterota bacterium]